MGSEMAKQSLIKEFDWFEYIKGLDVEEFSQFLMSVWNNNENIFPDMCEETNSACYGGCTDNNECILKFLKMPCDLRYKVTYTYADKDYGEIVRVSDIPKIDDEAILCEFWNLFGQGAEFDRCKSIIIQDRRNLEKGQYVYEIEPAGELQ